MTDTKTNTDPSAPKKRRRWLRALVWIFGILIVLLVVVYFVATSSAFFKGVILPKVSAGMNANVTVSDASISPFHQVILHNLKVQTTGAEPLLSAPEVRLRYSLMDIIHGNLHVDELALVSPTIVVVENPDGTRNFDPIIKGQAGKPQAAKPATPQPAAPSKPVQIDIVKVALTDATVRYLKLYTGGKQDADEVSHINVTLDNLKNGQPGKLALSADISVNNNPPGTNQAGVLLAKLSGSFDLTPAADLKGASLKGSTQLAVNRAEGALAQAAGFRTVLDCDVTPTDVKQLAVHLQKGDGRLGDLLVSGPLDQGKAEGHLTVVLRNIDKQLLNLAGAGSGVDFGPTTISSTNDIQLTKAGSSITAAGQFNINKLQVTRTNQTTPTLDFHTEYSVSVDTAAKTALLRTLMLSGMQNGAQMLHGDLSSPMTIAWSEGANAAGDSTLNLAVTGFDLAAWKPFLGSAVSGGMLTAQVKLLSQQGGKLLTFDLKSQLANLTAGSGDNAIRQADINLQVSGTATNLSQFNLSNYQFGVARQNQPLLAVAGSGRFDKSTQYADFQLDTQVKLAPLMQAMPRPGLSVSSGSTELKVHLIQTAQVTNQPKPATNLLDQITGSFALADFTGQFGSNALQSFGTTADLDVTMKPEQMQVQINKCSGNVTQGQNPGGSFDLSGTCNLSNKNTQITAKLMNLNQNALGPFLQAMLADKKLMSVALNASASVQYDPLAASTVKADLQITNLVVNDPKGQIPATPLEARMQTDLSLDKQILDLRQFQFGLTPTARATNQVQLTGKIDMSDTNAVQGNLKLVADSLDLTTYYDLFGGQSKGQQKPASGAATPSTTSTSTASGQEKEPIHLPVRNFVADASIRRLYLHEMEIDDWHTMLKLDGGHVQINPCQLTLNGAPVSTTVDADLGVPGYKYDVAFNAQGVPLAPLVDTFQPERKGQLGGTFSAQTKITGAGTTGPNLKKNLAGQFDMSSTNLNLSVVNIKNSILKLLVDVVGTIPDLLRNPTGTATSLIGNALGTPGSTGGLSSDLAKSPIQAIVARGNIGSGVVNLQQTTVRSSVFQADATGTVTLTDGLTNSILNIPVSISLSRAIAQKINFVPANTPTNAAYVKLPDFLTITGPANNPGKKIDTMALVQAVGTAALPKVGGTGGQVIQGVESIFGGGKSPATNTSSQPAQPGGGLGGLIRGLGGSAPATNATPQKATNAPPVNNLLNNLFGPR